MTKSPPGAAVAPDIEIAALIAAELVRKNKSLLALSEESGIAHPTLRRSMKGGRSLTINEIGRISAALSVHPSALLPATLTGEAA